MKHSAFTPTVLLLCAAAFCCAACGGSETPRGGGTAKAAQEEKAGAWAGVDETVVEKFAKEAGRPPREPYINTEQGDLLLFCFLVAGALGGFIAGYCFRALFPPRRRAKDEKDQKDEGAQQDQEANV